MSIGVYLLVKDGAWDLAVSLYSLHNQLNQNWGARILDLGSTDRPQQWTATINRSIHCVVMNGRVRHRMVDPGNPAPDILEATTQPPWHSHILLAPARVAFRRDALDYVVRAVRSSKNKAFGFVVRPFAELLGPMTLFCVETNTLRESRIEIKGDEPKITLPEKTIVEPIAPSGEYLGAWKGRDESSVS